MNCVCKVICGFTGVGKSECAKRWQNTLDLDASNYTMSNEFPYNYYSEIVGKMDRYEYILISTHEEIRKLLKKNDVRYTLVYPDSSLKKEYLQRYLDRKNSFAYCHHIQKNWDKWIDSMKMDECENHIILHSGEYLSDILK